MDLESLSCPKCGAPVSLPVGAAAGSCHYCNCAFRVPRSTVAPPGVAAGLSTVAQAPTTQLAADSSISAETVARIKQLLLLGKREAAVALYEAEAPCDRKTAEETVAVYVADVMWSTEAKTARLNAGGMVITAGALLLLAAAITLGVSGRVSWGGAVGMAGPGLLWTLFVRRRFFRTLRYLFATAGTGTVVRFGLVGSYGSSSVFRLLLDVGEPSGSTFRAETSALLSDVHASALKEGHQLRVKYLRDVPTSVVYDGELEA
jgi:hypothetical protein